MSAPQTNPEKQRRRHRGPLIGMTLAVIFGVVLILYWVLEEASVAENPIDSNTINAPAADNTIDDGTALGTDTAPDATTGTAPATDTETAPAPASTTNP